MPEYGIKMNRQSLQYTLANQNGFTLVEVMVALAIFTIGILGVNAMQLAAIKGNATANVISQATTWASDRVEILSGLNYTDSDLDDADGDGNTGLNDAECCSDGNDPDGTAVTGCTAKADGCEAQGTYSIYWNVAEDVTFPDIKNINVIVTKLDRGVPKSVTVSYMKSNSL
jgi:type IV pilus assembly protein PilV